MQYGNMDSCSTERIAIVINSDAPSSAQNYLRTCLRNADLIVTEEPCKGEQIFVVEAPVKIIAKEAEELEIDKKLKGSSDVEEFQFSHVHRYDGCDNLSELFTLGEQSALLINYLNKIPFSHERFVSFGIQKIPQQKSIIKCGLHSKPRLIESVTPLHHEGKRSKLWRKIKSNIFIFPLDDIRDYFGEEITYYFAWMNFFTWTLLPLSILGIFMYFHRPKGITVDDSPYLVFYAFSMAMWTIYFTKTWRRQESELAIKWNTTSVERVDSVRPEFYGVVRKSPITDKDEKYFPAWKRRMLFIVSFIITLPLLSLGYGAMILSLNFNGYIHDKESPFYFATLSSFAEPGHIFAADNKYYGWMIPTIGHSIVINILNKLYRTVAEFCTDLENHRTEHDWSSSLIVKRVLFEGFDCFLPLFYIAFYQLNIISLRRELIGLFWGDEIRRLVTETLIPFLTEKFHTVRAKKEFDKSKKSTGEKPDHSEVFENLILEEYEQFDDYLEMVMQFGYVTLFASAFPLCSIITIFFLFVEARSDIFKLLFLCRKPIAKRVCNIGVWSKVLSVMTIISMVTNSLLIGFSSEQLASWVPHMYETRPPDNDQWILPGYGRYVVGIVWGMEHTLIICLVLAHYIISDKPKWVRNELERREYLKKIKIKSL